MLNAVIGDYLELRGSELAIEMAFYHRNSPVALSREGFELAELGISPRLVVFLHGMAQTEASWAFRADARVSYGSSFQHEFGLTPLFVRYNTGRRIARNGRDLASLLEQLLTLFPNIEEINLIGHSLGGLVIRSACHHAAAEGQRWLGRTRRAVYIGSPHLGSPLERAGHLVSELLGVSQNPIVRLTRTLSNLRSAGIKDLRQGRLTEDEIDALCEPAVVPLCSDLNHYFVAGTLTQSETHLVTRLFGDALVGLPNATAPGRKAGLPASHFAILPGIHMDLARSPEVYTKLRGWFGEPRPSEAPRQAVVTKPLRTKRERNLRRASASLSLLETAVLGGSRAIQEIQEELSARPYGALRLIPPLEQPVEIVQRAHFLVLRNTYETIRRVTRLTGTLAHETIELLKDPPPR